ncbi:MAG: BCCT family transporter [Spirochaetia bacterium]|nr:BCCT family transporter [Spirochaetia bacterium]
MVHFISKIIRSIKENHHAEDWNITVRSPGEKNWKRWGFDLEPHVSIISAFVILFFILITLYNHNEASQTFQKVQGLTSDLGGWFLILSANIFLGIMIYLAFSRFGNIRLGGAKAKPEFSKVSWYSMLMAAGMGIGLMFYSVAEPILHFGAPPKFYTDIPGSPMAARDAMSLTFFHWGLHAWGIYALVGLSLAFFSFNKGLPLTIRSVFAPILGNQLYKWPGHVIDILSVVATLFGLATSLGLGAGQVNAGLNFLFGVPISATVQVILIAVITVFATMSVVAGLDKGVRRLSELNMLLAFLLMVFLLTVGPSVFLLGSFVQNLGHYISNLPALSFWTETFVDTVWQKDWTIFYWSWWISWSPFVGIFIARISKGRTVKEFIIGVLMIPTLLSFLWLSVFGGSALYLELNGIADIVGAVNSGVEQALFLLLEQFPLSGITSIIGIILVSVFFITSSDSGSLVVDHLTSGGTMDSPVPQRVFWASLEGIIAAVLLIGGGLKALQTAAITTGLPFAFVLLVMCYSIILGLSREWNKYGKSYLDEIFKETSGSQNKTHAKKQMKKKSVKKR